MRRANGADPLETINAAASAIASGENRASHASVQKRRWGSFWNLYWCFGWNKNKRIGHAVVSSETPTTEADASISERPSQQSSLVLPFVAPPSSPASFLPSEPPSATQSPTGILSLSSVSANMYSPGGPASMFAIGPYAHETQLVSPPIFSTFTTEPSTAPYTPPPESIHHMTTPSSPEVPFARLVEPNLQNGAVAAQRYPFSHQYEFQSYQLQPGSPVSHLISPSSGTSSPFHDPEFAAAHPFFLEFTTGIPPKLLDLEKIVISEWESRQGSGALTPDPAVGPRPQDNCVLDRQNSDVSPLPDALNRLRNNETVVDHRVSFEIIDEEVIRCVEKKAVALSESSSLSLEQIEREGHGGRERLVHEANAETSGTSAPEKDIADDEYEPRHKKNRTITLGSTKEFNFENVEGGSSVEPSISSSEWWVNEKVVAEDGGHSKNWSFFPMVQTGVS